MDDAIIEFNVFGSRIKLSADGNIFTSISRMVGFGACIFGKYLMMSCIEFCCCNHHKMVAYSIGSILCGTIAGKML